MEQKLTAAIAGAYFGCDVICAPYGGQPKRQIIGTMIGLNNRGIDIKFPEWQSPHNILISECQLILTPLSKISDEHAVWVYKIVFTPVGGTKDILVNKTQGGVTQMYSRYADNGSLSNGFMGIYPEGLEIIYRDDNKLENPDTYRALLIWDYLRSKGYDCGHGSIPSLISAGIAVEK